MRSDRAARAAMLLALLIAGTLPVASASAQGVNDDARCFLVSNGFAHLAKQDAARLAAAMTSAFYLGRLSGTPSQAGLVAAIRAQGQGMPGKQAEAIMRACADRANAAKQRIGAAVGTAQGATQPPKP